MRNVIIRKVNLSGVFQPLASTRTVGTFTLRSPTSGSGTSQLRGDDGVTSVPLDKGAQFVLERVDLANIYAKGGLGDFIVVVGATT